MRNFRRALRDSLRYWKSMLGATACSVAIAFLWSGNIAAFYPILQVVLQDQSVQQWLEEQSAESEQQITKSQKEIEEIALAIAAKPANMSDLQRRLAKSERNLSAARGALESYQSYKPWVDRLLPNDPFKTVSLIVVVLMVSTLLKHGFMMLNELLVARVAIDITRQLRSKLFQKALYIDRASFSNIGTSGFSSYIMQTADGLSNGLTSTLGGAIREPLKIAACLIGAALINFRLLLVSVIIAPIVGTLLYWITWRLKMVTYKTHGETMSFYEVMLESLNNMQTVQAYTMEKAEKARFDSSTNALRAIGLKLVFFTALAKPVIELLGLGMLCTTIVCGAYLVLKQKTAILGIPIASEPLSVQGLLTFFGMLIGLTDPLRRVSAIYSSIYSGSVSADAIYNLLDQPIPIADPAEPAIVNKPHQLLSVQGVSFGYRPDHTVIHGVNLDIPFGSTVAIVGANGSGKSTMINLLCRFYDPVAGRLCLDDHDLRSMQLSDLRGRIALVTQQTELFNETVRYNIRYGSPNATDAMVEQAAREAHATEFIANALPNGFETKVGQGGHRLSGGQRQRIALARALLRNPELLILDECTSQIDMHSEMLIRTSLAEHRGKRTIIIITHREALLHLADVIYEVRDGQFHLQTSPMTNAA